MSATPPDDFVPMEVSQGYRPPVSALLDLPSPNESEDCDYAKLGIQREHIPELIRMVTDRLLAEQATEEDGPSGPVHAWRALCAMDAFEAITPLLAWFDVHSSSLDDWFWNELAWSLMELGDGAVPPLNEWLQKEPPTRWASTACAYGLAEVGKWNPTALLACVSGLTASLGRFADHTPQFNAHLISSLAELRALKAVPLIKKAIAAGAVDLDICGPWENLEETLNSPADIDEIPDIDPESLSDADLDALDGGNFPGFNPAGPGDLPLDLLGNSRATGPHLATPEPGRNDPCPCGSGKKYKKCCGK